MPKAHLTRAVKFSAAHRYHNPMWSPERNEQEFGACTNEHGHGHTYRCLVTVGGPVAEDTSMVISVGQRYDILGQEVTQRLDHKHLNLDVPDFNYGKTVPTAEALAVYIWDKVAAQLPNGVALDRVRVEENSDLFADYYGTP